MNHLEKAQEYATEAERLEGTDTILDSVSRRIQAHALIAIAEQLERIAVVQERDAELNKALEDMLNKEDK